MRLRIFGSMALRRGWIAATCLWVALACQLLIHEQSKRRMLRKALGTPLLRRVGRHQRKQLSTVQPAASSQGLQVVSSCCWSGHRNLQPSGILRNGNDCAGHASGRKKCERRAIRVSVAGEKGQPKGRCHNKFYLDLSCLSIVLPCARKAFLTWLSMTVSIA